MKIDESGKLTLQISVDINGPILEVEERIQHALNGAGCTLTEKALEQFDTDGSPVMRGSIKWTRRCTNTQTYQTPYGGVRVNRHVYQTSRGGKTYVPLEAGARIVSCATPRFAMMIASKYARLNAGAVVADLRDNHARSTSRATLQRIADCVGAIAAAKEQSWSYETPKLDQAISSVVCSLDGAMLLTVNDGWREAMVGALSLYDCDGERQHTTYFGAAPQYGKEEFFKRFERELERIKEHYPDALYLGIADGAKDNWSFLDKHTGKQLLDFYHATEYLAKVAYAAHPEKTGKPKRQQWLKDRCHELKHEPGAAKAILKKMQGYARKRKLNQAIRADLSAAISYFKNQLHRMNYASHVEQNLPIGSGVTEAACKTLVKQRFCCSGMRWKETGIKTVLSLRSLIQTEGRWEQFWNKIERYGVPCLS
jgi:hypothetical protein